MFRVGNGYDVHRLVIGRKLILGGVEIPFDKGLLGHSDADVLVHAIMDALLGACGERDIGVHFPDNDDSYKGISSILLLEKVMEIVRKKGYEIGNIDSTVIAQSPRLSPYIDEMKRNVAHALKVEESQISVKATTTEGMGFSGKGKGMEAYAVVLIYKSCKGFDVEGPGIQVC